MPVPSSFSVQARRQDWHHQAPCRSPTGVGLRRRSRGSRRNSAGGRHLHGSAPRRHDAPSAANDSPSSGRPRSCAARARRSRAARPRYLQPAQLAAERDVHPERAAEVDLEALLAVDDRALQADVGGLEPRARVGATVEVDVIGVSNSGSRSLELLVELPSAPSSRRSRACRTRCPCRPSCRDGTPGSTRRSRRSSSVDERLDQRRHVADDGFCSTVNATSPLP